jgi:hypothetical protein
VIGRVETTMLRLKPKQRAVTVEKLPDLANIAAGFFVFGQFVGDEPTSIWLVSAGIAIWVTIAGVTLLIPGGEA